MTVPTPENQQELNKSNDKELNFRALELKYQKQLETERIARIEAERRADEAVTKRNQLDEEEEDDEPYVDRKKLRKEQEKFGQQMRQQTQSEIQKAVQTALQEERKNNWMKQNPDFYEVLQYADKFAKMDEELAETILSMPEGFDRQKLVYKNIKALGLHKPEAKQPSIQDTIDAKRKSPYYQPSQMGAAPYAQVGDFSPAGQKNAHDHMKALQQRLRLG